MYYTRKGDKGYTGICDIKRVSKASLRIKAFGDVDELCAWIGFSKCVCKDKEIAQYLARIQNDLFVLGSDLAAPLGSKFANVRIRKEQIEWMEKSIDKITKRIGKLKYFILPGGSELASRLHIARTVCRRAERTIVELSRKKKLNSYVLPYINRLSSLLFVLARLVNKKTGIKETEWFKQA